MKKWLCTRTTALYRNTIVGTNPFCSRGQVPRGHDHAGRGPSSQAIVSNTILLSQNIRTWFLVTAYRGLDPLAHGAWLWTSQARPANKQCWFYLLGTKPMVTCAQPNKMKYKNNINKCNIKTIKVKGLSFDPCRYWARCNICTTWTNCILNKAEEPICNLPQNPDISNNHSYQNTT